MPAAAPCPAKTRGFAKGIISKILMSSPSPAGHCHSERTGAEAEPFSWQQTSYFDAVTTGSIYEEMCDVNGTRIADDWYYYDNGTWVPMSSSPCPLWD